MSPQAERGDKPIVLITGSAGNIGKALGDALRDDYYLIGLDRVETPHMADCYVFDLTSEKSVRDAMCAVKQDHGEQIAAVIHLAAYFDFSGEPSPLYEKVNIQGTVHLLRALQELTIERFIYSSTMLVHAATPPGHKIDETAPLAPKWAYPQSKRAAEEVIEREHGGIPYTILRLAGLYDEMTAVPTLAHQIQRIYERDLKSHLYAGDLGAGQAFLHRDDMIDAFRRAVDHRDGPAAEYLLIGEDVSASYEELQNRIGELIYGAAEWKTLSLPSPLAKAGAWAQEKSEPVVPDAIDRGEKPFIRPFMIDLASDHYALDIRNAAERLGWRPRHRILDELPTLIANLKKDPAAWYKANGITPPDRVAVAGEMHRDAHSLASQYESDYRHQHHGSLWAHFLNMALALWLIAAPATLGYESLWMRVSDIAAGGLLFVFAGLSLSPRLSWARWGSGAVGLWLLVAPLLFWAPTAGAYLNDSLAGMLAIGFALLVRPSPGIATMAATTGPTVPPGWRLCPSDWSQRLPIIILALFGLLFSRYLAAYQLGHIDGVWEPFFSGTGAQQNGTEEIITSTVSEAWPVPDAGLGALIYALEILTGIMGSPRRWRTGPWLVLFFATLIVPLGVVSVTFVIIQPIVIGTWCTLCLFGALLILLQIAYSADELVATCQFLRRRQKAGRPMLRVFFLGDTDESQGDGGDRVDDLARPPRAIIRDMLTGGITVPWNLALIVGIGIWLMVTRLTLGTDGAIANTDHLVGALAITVAIPAMAECFRTVRFLAIPLGAGLIVATLIYNTGTASLISGIVCGLALIALSLRRGPVRSSYGSWDRFIV